MGATHLPPLILGAPDADVPPDLVPPDDRAAVAAVRADPTLVIPLPVRRVEAPVEIFEGFLDDLPHTAKLVAARGMGSYRIERRPDGTLHIDDHRGARARVARLVERPGVRVYRALGEVGIFPAPFLYGTGVIALRFEPAGAGALLTGGKILFRLESELLHRIARPIVRLLEAAIDHKVRSFVSAAIAICEHEARARAGPIGSLSRRERSDGAR